MMDLKLGVFSFKLCIFGRKHFDKRKNAFVE